VSNAVPGKVVIDAGTKTLTSDRNIPNPESGHGYVVQYPLAKITRLSEEHGELDITACDRVPAIGERVEIIPNHICPCVNLQDTAFIRTAEGALRSITIDARGKLS
jgi:D-serine deaminase-like pyridoxal phosphate-dependent protein